MSRPSHPDSKYLPVSITEKTVEIMMPPEQVQLPTSPVKKRSGKFHLSLPLRLYDQSGGTKEPGSTPTLQYASVPSSHPPPRPSLNIQCPKTAPTSSNGGPRSPAPSMSNSSKKIRQIMGIDLSSQFFGPEDDGVSQASSESLDSTNEDGNRLMAQLHAERTRDENSAMLFADPSERSSPRKSCIEVVRNSEWSFSEDEQFCTRRPDEHSRRSSGLRNSKPSVRTETIEDMATLKEILYDELQRDVQSPVESNYRTSLVDTRDLPLSPIIATPVSHLSTPSPKGSSKVKPIEVPKKPSFFANSHTRESYAWGSEYRVYTRQKKGHLLIVYYGS